VSELRQQAEAKQLEADEEAVRAGREEEEREAERLRKSEEEREAARRAREATGKNVDVAGHMMEFQ